MVGNVRVHVPATSETSAAVGKEKGAGNEGGGQRVGTAAAAFAFASAGVVTGKEKGAGTGTKGGAEGHVRAATAARAARGRRRSQLLPHPPDALPMQRLKDSVKKEMLDYLPDDTRAERVTAQATLRAGQVSKALRNRIENGNRKRGGGAVGGEEGEEGAGDVVVEKTVVKRTIAGRAAKLFKAASRNIIMTNKLSKQMGFQNGDAGGHDAAGMQAIRNPFGRRTSVSSLSQAELAATAPGGAGEAGEAGDEGRSSTAAAAAAAANTNHNHDGVEGGTSAFAPHHSHALNWTQKRTTFLHASPPCAAGGAVILSLNEARRERNKNTIARRSSTKGVAPEATIGLTKSIRRRSSTQGVLPENMGITRRSSTKGVAPAAAMGISRRSSTKGL